jgi:hypothetical protein
VANIGEEIYGPSWKMQLKQIDLSMAKRNMTNEFSDKRYYSPTEVGFIHQDNKSNIRIEDNGDIDIYSSEVFGIKVNKDEETINVSAQTTNLIAQNITLYTQPTGLAWNGYYLNPTLYMKIGRGIPKEDKNIRLAVQYETWDYYWERYKTVSATMPLFIKKPVSTIYDQSINKLLQDLDIPL